MICFGNMPPTTIAIAIRLEVVSHAMGFEYYNASRNYFKKAEEARKKEAAKAQDVDADPVDAGSGPKGTLGTQHTPSPTRPGKIPRPSMDFHDVLWAIDIV